MGTRRRDDDAALTASRLVAAKLGAALIHDNEAVGLRQIWSEGEIIEEHTRSDCEAPGYPFGMYDPPQFL